MMLRTSSRPDKKLLKARFGVFEMDTATGELQSQSGSSANLTPQLAKILTLLVQRAGEVVQRDELRQALWGEGTFVDFERGLNVAVGQLRALLGDDAKSPRYIETLVKRGYRFVAPVEWVDSNVHVPRRAWQSRASAAAAAILIVASILAMWPQRHRTMLAVWPFDNLSGDPAQSYVADGMTEEMVADLGRLAPRSLGVIAGESVRRIKQSGRGFGGMSELPADYVLGGSIRRGAGRVLIVARLIRMSDQAQLWTETYESASADIVNIQRRVAQRIMKSLAVELVGSQRTALARASTMDTAAYDDFLEAEAAIQAGTEESYQQVRKHLESAIRRDPEFAMAYAVLSHVNLGLMQYGSISREEVCKESKRLAERALELDQELPDAHLSLAVETEMCETGPAVQVEALYQRALSLNPSSVGAHLRYGYFLSQSGRNSQAVAEMKRARDLDPLSPMVNAALALALASAKRDGEASRQAKRALELAPMLPYALYAGGVTEAQEHRFSVAIPLLEKAVSSSPKTATYAYALGMTYCRAGRCDQARTILDRLNDLAKRKYVPVRFLSELSQAIGESRR